MLPRHHYRQTRRNRAVYPGRPTWQHQPACDRGATAQRALATAAQCAYNTGHAAGEQVIQRQQPRRPFPSIELGRGVLLSFHVANITRKFKQKS